MYKRLNLCLVYSLFTQLPMRRMRTCFTDVFFCFCFCFFLFFSVRQKNTRQPFSGTAERNLMNLLPNDSWENVVSNVVPKWGLGPNNFLGGGGLKTTHCALGGDAWRMNRKNYFMLVCWLRHCALYGGCVKNA